MKLNSSISKLVLNFLKTTKVTATHKFLPVKNGKRNKTINRNPTINFKTQLTLTWGIFLAKRSKASTSSLGRFLVKLQKFYLK